MSRTADPTIRTDRLILRRARPDDVEPLHAVYGDPACMRYWLSGPDTTLAATERRVTRQIEQDRLEYFVFEQNGVAIGNGGHVEKGEIGYILRQDAWGRGFAREGMAAILAYLWTILDLPALRAEIDPRNLASVMVLTRLGFEICGYAQTNLLVGKEYVDSAYFILPRPDLAQMGETP